VLRPDKPTELGADEWNGRLVVNVSGAQAATNTVLARLWDGCGTLLFTGGGFGLHSTPDFNAMSVGKAALRACVLALFDDTTRTRGVHQRP
jgi:NADP-dependent 3-hydroxy acid dehydrogenase YdfG